MHSVEYGTTTIEFAITRKANLKNTYINVNTTGVIVKTNDTTTITEVENMVRKKRRWISKKLGLFKAIAVNKDISTGSRLYYMGKSYYVQMLTDEDIDIITIHFTHSKFYITTPVKYSDAQLHNAIEDFYKHKAIEKIIPLTKKWAKTMQVCPKHIGFRYSKTQWGSCSGSNRISFNYHLMKLSSSLIEYVVIHELAHIIFKNHSKDFWRLIYVHLSDYKIKEDKIKVFEKRI